MATLKTTNVQHPDSPVANITLLDDGSIGGELGTTLGSKLDVSAYQPGLELITSNTFTTASSVSIDNCFTSAYDNYRMMFVFTLSSSGGASFRFRAGGTDNSASNYNFQSVRGAGTNAAAGSTAGGTSFDWPPNSGVADPRSCIIYDVFSPALSEQTAGLGQFNYGDQSIIASIAAGHTSTSSFDGFTYFRGSGTFTGRLYVYGYRKA